MKAVYLLIGAATAIQRHHHHSHRPYHYQYFATGMNGDEDLGQDITMKGEKFHYAQEPKYIQLADVNGSWVDPNFKPHPVLPDPIHKDRL